MVCQCSRAYRSQPADFAAVGIERGDEAEIRVEVDAIADERQQVVRDFVAERRRPACRRRRSTFATVAGWSPRRSRRRRRAASTSLRRMATNSRRPSLTGVPSNDQAGSPGGTRNVSRPSRVEVEADEAVAGRYLAAFGVRGGQCAPTRP